MPDDAQQIRLIRSQTLSLMAQLTEHPKPTYWLDGQTVSWGDYLSRLQGTVEWCDRQLAGEEPFEFHTQGHT